MIPLAMLFEAMEWPLFNFWAMAHGSFILAWPMLALITLVVRHLRSRKDSK